MLEKQNHVCLSCQLEKISQLSFPLTMHRSSVPLELIHIDIWSPTPITSHTGHRYYIHFLDDFSKISWFYVLKSQTNVLCIFQAFCMQIKKYFSRKIKMLQSNGAEEFLFVDFQNELQ